MEESMNKKSVLLIGVIVIAALTRLVDHPPNFTPVAAMALFGGACFANRKVAFLAPIAAMFLSDVLLAFTRYPSPRQFVLQPVVYGCILATTAIGHLIKDRRSVLQVGEATLSGSILFYLVTNFAVWAGDGGHAYPQSAAGLVSCYEMGIPFFKNTLLGDAVYSTILFGGLAFVEQAAIWMKARARSVA
jgi:hypothetical protein